LGGPEAEFILKLIKEGLGMKLESIEQAKASVERYLSFYDGRNRINGT
jgi:hypothetical protein